MPDLLQQMIDHPHVAVRAVEELPGVVACNFTRKAFTEGHWDGLTTAARGLFLRASTGEVLARGFEKFFTPAERGLTTRQALDQMTAPVTVTMKENGYLGIIAVIDGNLVVLSKSGITDYSRHAERMLDRGFLTDGDRQRFIDLLAKHNASLLVEVVDPQHDPHIVAYGNPHLVALALVRNTARFELLEDRQRDRIGALAGILTPLDAPIIANDAAELASALDEMARTSDEEGVVVTDVNGAMLKIKFERYRLVKSYRGCLTRALVRGIVDQRAAKVVAALAEQGRALEDYRLTSITGQPVLDLPRLAPVILAVENTQEASA